jgi:hypothetical protein
MVSSGMVSRVALVRTDVSEERSASFIRVTIGELGTTPAVTSNRRTSVATRATRRNIPQDAILHSHRCENHFVFLRSLRRLLVTASVVPSSPILVTLMKEAISSSETSVLTTAIRRNIQQDAILHSHRHENLKSYIQQSSWYHTCNSSYHI